jgi:ribosome-associated protein YbcJ (S4-like RNA binding protein)
MKCKFGCGEFGRGGACPPQTPSVDECSQFFNEYSDAVILHFEDIMDKPEDRHSWSRKINAKLVKITGLCSTGGMAKIVTAEGRVKVDNQTERRKHCKIRKGQVVDFEGNIIEVL